MMKRIVFASIQAGHRLPVRGAMPNPIRTGYDNIIAHRVDDKFAYTAKQDGVIKEKAPKYVIVEYKDGSQVNVELGVRVASSKGNYYKHELICDLEKGFKFKKGHVLVFNTAFFTRDLLNLSQVVPKDRIIARMMFIESDDTFEDSSAMSSKLFGPLTTVAVKQKLIVVNANDNLLNVVKVGDYVEEDTELAIIDDQVFSDKTHFDSSSTEILKRLSKISPKAGVKGKITKIEGFFFCEEDELSPSIKQVIGGIVKETFSGTKTHIKDRRALSGQINEPLKFGGDLIGPGQVGIRIFIEYDLGIISGDKFVFFNQGKSVLGRVWDEDIKTETGRDIHVMFGYTSVNARIIASPSLIGTTNTLLRLVTERALSAYRR